MKCLEIIKNNRPKGIILGSALTFLISFIIFSTPIISSKYNSNLLWNHNFYDGFSIQHALKNNIENGISKHFGFQNRKGNTRIDFHLPYKDGCLYLTKNDAPMMNTVYGEKVLENSLTNDCIYAHYPPLIDWIYYGLSNVHFINPDSFKSLAIFSSLINALLFTSLFVLFSLIFKSTLIPIIPLLLMVFTPSILIRYGVYYRPLETLFFVLQFISFIRKKNNCVYIFGILGGMTGLDFIAPNVALIILSSKKIVTRGKVLALFILFIPQLTLRYFLYKQHHGIFTEVRNTISDRFGATSDYFEVILKCINSYFYYMDKYLINIYLFISILIIILFLSKKYSLPKGLYLKTFLFLLFASINMSFLLPKTAFIHTWSTFHALLLPISFLISWMFYVLTKVPKIQNKIIFSLLALILFSFLNYKIYLKTINNIQQILNIENSTNISNLNLIKDVIINSDQKMGWGTISKSKTILLPTINFAPKTPEQIFSHVFPIASTPLSGLINYRIILNNNAVVNRLTFIYTGESLSRKCSVQILGRREIEFRELKFDKNSISPSQKMAKAKLKIHSFSFQPLANLHSINIACKQKSNLILRIWPQ